MATVANVGPAAEKSGGIAQDVNPGPFGTHTRNENYFLPAETLHLFSHTREMETVGPKSLAPCLGGHHTVSHADKKSLFKR